MPDDGQCSSSHAREADAQAKVLTAWITSEVTHLSAGATARIRIDPSQFDCSDPLTCSVTRAACSSGATF